MPKSIYAVGGIGVLGCLLLSFMMQHLLTVKQDHGSSPVAKELEDAFGHHLAGPVQVSMLTRNEQPTMVVKMTTKPGVMRDRLVASADSLLWSQIAQLPQQPAIVHFEVEDADGAPTVVVDLKPPRFLQARQPPKPGAKTNGAADRGAPATPAVTAPGTPPAAPSRR